MRRHTTSLLCTALAAALGGWLSTGTGQEKASPSPPEGDGPDLVAGLADIEGCLGIETAQTRSGKSVIFAWFQDLDAALDWYYSDAHQDSMRQFMGPEYEPGHEEPLMYLNDHEGPILAIASITPAAQNGVEGVDMAISQIAIELYTPLPGGLAVNGRFAPDALKVPHMLGMNGEAPEAPADVARGR